MTSGPRRCDSTHFIPAVQVKESGTGRSWFHMTSVVGVGALPIARSTCERRHASAPTQSTPCSCGSGMGCTARHGSHAPHCNAVTHTSPLARDAALARPAATAPDGLSPADQAAYAASDHADTSEEGCWVWDVGSLVPYFLGFYLFQFCRACVHPGCQAQAPLSGPINNRRTHLIFRISRFDLRNVLLRGKMCCVRISGVVSF